MARPDATTPGRSRPRRWLDELWAMHRRTTGLLVLDPGELASILDHRQGSATRSEAGREAWSEGDAVDPSLESGTVQAFDGTPPDGDRSPFDLGDRYGRRQLVGFVLGPLAFALAFLWPTPAGLSPAGQAVGAVTLWVAIWWITEAIPIPATSLLPLVAFPLTGAVSLAETAPSYAHPIIFLFMGGFFLAVAMQRWNLHRRIALRTVALVGTRPRRLMLGFMLATAFLSMWVSNTATVMMMVPIAMAVLAQATDRLEGLADLRTAIREGEFEFGLVLMLAIAYSASVGGVGTLIGSPPNIIFAGQVNELFGETITFLSWMYYGVPIAVLGLAVVYVYLIRLGPGRDIGEAVLEADVVETQLAALGPMSPPERRVLVVFAGMAGGWIGASLAAQLELLAVPANADSIVAIGGALVLFAWPTRTPSGERTFLLDWAHAVSIPWGVILLFGGGLAIAAGFAETGLAIWIGGQLTGLEGISLLGLLVIVVALTIFMTEVTSNTATAAMLLPIVAGVAVSLGWHPYALMVAAATAASFAFMLPVATPPNAIVFGSGYLTLPQMARVGIWLNLVAIVLITAIALLWVPVAWGIDPGVIPPFVDG